MSVGDVSRNPSPEEPLAWLKDLDLTGFETVPREVPYELLVEILGNHNAMAVQINDFLANEEPNSTVTGPQAIRLDIGDYLSLNTREYGNAVAVAVNRPSGQPDSHLKIGYFSPSEGQFLIYPEYVSDEDNRALVREVAAQKRADWIAAFNNKVGQTETRQDYGNPAISLLHLTHWEFLDRGSGDILGLLERYNDERIKDYSNYVELDNCTRAAVYISGLSLIKGIVQFDAVGAWVRGSFKQIDGIPIRHPNTLRIALAHRDTASSDPREFDANDNVLDAALVDSWIEQAEMPADLYAQYRERGVPGQFIPEELALNLPPQQVLN